MPVVGDQVPTAVELFGGRDIGFGEGYFTREFPDKALTAYGDFLVKHFAERVRKTESGNLLVAHWVRELVDAVCSAVDSSVAQPLIEAATEAGFLDGGTRPNP